MRVFTAAIILLAAFSPCYAGAAKAEPLPELIVDIGEHNYLPKSPSEDSIMVFVYVESVSEPIAGIDLWIVIDHDNLVHFMSDSVWRCDTVYFNCEDSTCIEWAGEHCLEWEYFNCHDTLINCSWVQLGAVRLEGTLLEDWDIVNVNVHGSQRMMLQLYGLAISAPPIPPGPGFDLLVKLVFEVTDKTGFLIDSLCSDTDFYDEFGVTEIWVDAAASKFSDETGYGLIGWYWDVFCVDSVCTEWLEDSCITWECTEWDSVYAPDTAALHYYDGSITLICGDCDAYVGDADGSGVIDIDDIVYLVQYIFEGSVNPIPYPTASGDSDCSGIVDIDDVVYMIEHIFSFGPVPCSCEEWVAQNGALR